uniref:SOSS complex subunit C n=1 Tax=Labrus bergylta TaxID=56723 RepID=A0A3Q3G6T1_9LABR
MASNPPGQAFPNKARVAILAEIEKEKRRLLQSQTMKTPGASISLSRPNLKEFRDNAEQQHIAAQQKAALQVRLIKKKKKTLQFFFCWHFYLILLTLTILSKLTTFHFVIVGHRTDTRRQETQTEPGDLHYWSDVRIGGCTGTGTPSHCGFGALLKDTWAVLVKVTGTSPATGPIAKCVRTGS